ncbi:MAG: hypothetical protein IT464_02025 [Planctomycetes bacterium]|nr:hypothetical protein [Planctomycetota bacterium]
MPTAGDNVVIPDTTSLPNAPTLVTGAVCNDLTINASGVLNGGTGNLSMSGNWTNNGTFTQGTSMVLLVGDSDTNIGGTSSSTFYQLVINKTARTTEVVQLSPVIVTGLITSPTLAALDIRQGTYRNGGQNLTVGSRVTGTAPANGELHVSGGTVVFNNVYQFSALKQFTVTGGNITITGTHDVVNSSHRFDMSAGTIAYTSTGTNIWESSNNSTWGYFMTGGHITLSGSIDLNDSGNVFQATGTAIVEFVGSTNTTARLRSSTSSTSTACKFDVSELRVNKTGGATLNIFHQNPAGTNPGDYSIGNLVIGSGGGVTISAANGPGFAWRIGNISTAISLNLSAPTFFVSGSIASTGAGSCIATGSVTMSGSAPTASVLGNNSFSSLTINSPGRTITFGAGNTTTFSGTMILQGVSGNPLLLRSSSASTQWLLQVNGTVTADYCDVQDGNASSAVTVNGGTNSGNNTNWNFGAAPAAHTWTGATSTAWGTATNWNPASVPTATNDVIIPDTSALPNQPTLSATATCRSLTIQASGVLNGSTGTLTVNAHWTNNGTFNAGTSLVIIAGGSTSVIGGSATSTFQRLAITKTGRTIEVLQTAPVVVTGDIAQPTLAALDIRTGTYRNGGNNLTVVNSRVSSTVAALGELHISGGTVSLPEVYQFSALKTFSITGGTVSVRTHQVVNSGHRFEMTGGTLEYTATGASLNLNTSSNNSSPSGVYISGGTVTFNGSVTIGSTPIFQVTGSGKIVFAGSATSSFNLYTGSGTWVVFINELSAEKTGAAVLNVLSTSATLIPSNLSIPTLNVAAGGALSLNGNFATGFGFAIGSISNAGGLTLASTLVSVTGNIATTGAGTLTASATNTTRIAGSATSSITGDSTFQDLTCNIPGRRVNFGAGDTVTINGALVFIGSGANKILLRSTSAGNQWLLQVTGTVTAVHCDVQDSAASSTVYAAPGGVDSGNNTNWQFGSVVTVLASTGATQNIWANDVSGAVNGTFVVENTGASAATLDSIDLRATGTGNDSTAYSEVAIYIDNPSSGNVGSYDAADTIYDAAVTAFATNDGTLVFTDTLALAAASVTRCFVVVKFNGATLPAPGQTFRTIVDDITVTGSPTAGLPSQTMAGHVIQQPQLNVTFPVSTNRPAAWDYTGPGGDGFVFERFQVQNNSPLNVTITQLSLLSFGTVSTAIFTSVELFMDANGSGNWERASDTKIGGTFTSWNTTHNFTNTSIGPNETLLYFTIVKLGGGTAPANGSQFGHFFMSNSAAVGAIFTGTINSGSYRLTIQSASLYVAAEPGTVTQRLANDATDVQTGKFTLSNTSTGTNVNLTSITLSASGTGNDSNAYSQVALYRDTNANGFWDGGDALFGAAATAFAGDNGTRAFTSSALAIAGGSSATFFVVTRMNGATLASAGHTFHTQVTAIVSNVASDGLGLPSAIMQGVQIIDTTLVVSATTGTAAGVYANETGTGGNGFEAGVFTITASGSGTPDLLTITLAASGTGDDSTAYTEVAIYEDSASGAVGSYDNANDTLVDTAAAFPADDGSLVFNVPSGLQPFSVSQAKTYFVVVKLNGSAIPAETFEYTVSAISVGTGAGSSGTPSGTMAGLDINAPDFNITDTSPATQGIAAPGGADYLMQQFEVAYPNGPDNTLTSITFTGSAISGGTLQADIVQADLYRDDNANGVFDGADVQVDTQTGFNGSNQVIFTISGTESQFTAGTTKVYFLMVQFDAATPSGAEYATQLTTASGASTGTNINGTPAPAAGTAPGLIYYANNLNITLNGPVASTTVNSNSQGPGGAGHVIWDGTLTTIAAAWTATELEFEGTGTANANLAYDSLALYEDSNASGVYDAGDALAVAAAAVSFDASSLYLAQLTNTTFAATSSRRFFLVGTLAGSATTGQTLNARITSVTATPPAGGTVTGDVNVDSTALTIDVATITLGNGPTPPANATIDTGVAQTHVLAKFRLTASNQDVTVTQIDFTTAGTGDWVNDLDPTAGVQVWRDNGDGSFDSTTDTQIFQGAGAALVAATFTPSVVVPNAGSVDLWVRLSLLATAAAGASVPETLSLSVPAASAITAGGVTALLGTPAPVSSTLSIVDFFVTTFAPVADFPAGGVAITIDGNGFNAPFSVTIGGALCPGTPVINGTGTQVTGLLVPPGSGTTLAIVVTSGSLPPQTITQTFSYSTVGSTGGGKSKDGGGGCSAQHSGWALLLGALGLMAIAGVTRRRRA